MNRALIVVDMQNDFLTGSLIVPGGLELVGAISEKVADAINERVTVIFTADWHSKNHKSFKENGGSFPEHCVIDSWGADIQVALWNMADFYSCPIICKGQDPNEDGFSGFSGTELHEMLQDLNVTNLEICGVARNYCVEATAEDARKLGYNVTVLEDLCRTV